MKSKFRNIFFYALFVLLILFLFTYINFLFWKNSELKNSNLKNHLQGHMNGVALIGSKLYNQVGWLGDPVEKAKYFSHFDKNKSRSVIRIGAFGDSYTYGDEVSDSYDFVSLLQGELGRKFEVLNFGNPGWGFFQTYTLWKKLGESYNLDVLLLGPACFQADRDETFSTGWKRSSIALHSLYKLSSDESLVRVDINGDDVLARFDSYNSFVPNLENITLDRFAPALYHSLALSHGSLINPFYKKQDLNKIYQIQLGEMVKKTKRVIMLHSNSDLVKNLKNNSEPGPIELDVLSGTKYLESFPYVMTKHYSSLGNDIVAKDFARKILKNNASIPVLLTQKSNPLKNDDQTVKKILNVSISIGTQSIGLFNRVLQHSNPVDDTKLFIHNLNQDNFLMIKGFNQSILDGFGRFVDRADFPKSLILQSGGNNISLPIKKIAPHFYFVELPEHYIVESFVFNQIKSGHRFKLHYNGDPFVTSIGDYGVVPPDEEKLFFKFSPRPDVLLDYSKLDEVGNVSLILEGPEDTARIRLDRYKLKGL